jgi:hypothetical protein
MKSFREFLVEKELIYNIRDKIADKVESPNRKEAIKHLHWKSRQAIGIATEYSNQDILDLMKRPPWNLKQNGVPTHEELYKILLKRTKGKMDEKTKRLLSNARRTIDYYSKEK